MSYSLYPLRSTLCRVSPSLTVIQTYLHIYRPYTHLCSIRTKTCLGHDPPDLSAAVMIHESRVSYSSFWIRSRKSIVQSQKSSSCIACMGRHVACAFCTTRLLLRPIKHFLERCFSSLSPRQMASVNLPVRDGESFFRRRSSAVEATANTGRNAVGPARCS